MPIRSEFGVKLTYEDYAKLPRDGRRHEIIEGRHFVNAAPRPGHQAILRNAMRVLDALQLAGRAEVLCAPLDVHLTETDVVQPDVIVIAGDRSQQIGARKIEGAPQLVLEIVAPATARLDRGAKRSLYEAAGVQEYWIIDPQDGTLNQLTLTDGRFTDRLHRAGLVSSTAFPGFTIGLSRFFDGRV